MSGGRTVSLCRPRPAYPSASANRSLHARRMHAYNACVVRALRHVFVSRLKPSNIKPQGGHPKNLPSHLPFLSLGFSSPSQST